MLENIKNLRDLHKISQQKLADAVGLTQQSIYQYENGIAEPDIETLKKIANYFEVSVDYIVGNTDAMCSVTKEDCILLKKIHNLSDNTNNAICTLLDELNEK